MAQNYIVGITYYSFNWFLRAPHKVDIKWRIWSNDTCWTRVFVYCNMLKWEKSCICYLELLVGWNLQNSGKNLILQKLMSGHNLQELIYIALQKVSYMY